MSEVWFIKVVSKSGTTQKLLTLVTKKATNEWVEKAEKLNNPRTYHNIEKFDKFNELFKEIGWIALAGAGEVYFYQAKQHLDNCDDIIAILNDSYNPDCPCLEWHEEPGRYSKKIIEKRVFDEYKVNVGTLKNPSWKTLGELEPKATIKHYC